MKNVEIVGKGKTYSLFKIISAAITPGIQPKIVNINTIINEPQPLSIIESGGNIMANRTLNILIT